MALIDMAETFQMTNPGEHIDATDVYNSNDNLLDNAYFVGGGSQLGDGVFPINQRGQTSYAGGYGIDRWRCWKASTVTLSATGLTFTTGANADGLFQYFSKGKFESLYGETVTTSLLLTDRTLYTATGTASADCWIATSFSGGYFGYVCNGTEANFRINLDANKSKSIKACKLEKGTYSTLLNDVQPDFGKELEKCKRYLQRVRQPQGYKSSVGFGMVGAASNILRTTIPLSSPLRNATSITATATNTGQMFVWGNGSYYSVTGVTGRTVLNGNAIVDITVNGTLENYKTYNLILNNADAYIDLSAPL